MYNTYFFLIKLYHNLYGWGIVSRPRKSKDLRIDVEGPSSKISLKEMSEDIGAFLHFLKNHSVLADHYSNGSEHESEESYWL